MTGPGSLKSTVIRQYVYLPLPAYFRACLPPPACVCACLLARLPTLDFVNV